MGSSGGNSFARTLDPLGLVTAPEAHQIGDFSLSSKQRKGENLAMRNFMDQAKGKNLVTDAQLAQSSDMMQNQLASQAASQRGSMNPAIAAREAMLMGQQGQLQMNQAAQAQRLQEQQSANQALLQNAQAQRGMALQGSVAQANANAQAQQAQAQKLGAIGQTVGGFAMMSDKNAKKDISENSDKASNMVEDFLKALKSYSYEYKDGKGPKGEQTSVMAQDLEKSDLGKKMVKDTPEGKMVDYSQGMATLFASIAELNKKIDKIKK